MTKPTKGRIVILSVPAERNGGEDTAPAIVTHVWSEREDGSYLINAYAFLVTGGTPFTSIGLYPNRQERDDAAERWAADTNLASGAHVAAWWPERDDALTVDKPVVGKPVGTGRSGTAPAAGEKTDK